MKVRIVLVIRLIMLPRRVSGGRDEDDLILDSSHGLGEESILEIRFEGKPQIIHDNVCPECVHQIVDSGDELKAGARGSYGDPRPGGDIVNDFRHRRAFIAGAA